MLSPNQGKNITIEINGATYARWPIRTHVIKNTDRLFDIMDTYVRPQQKDGDVLFISERIVAITQGRAYPIRDIHPTRLATFLSRHVHQSPYGIGLGSPWTMQLALDEVGMGRILLGAVVAVLTKPFGIKGMFYRVCGRAAASIDGPCSYTLPPYNEYAKLGPKNPNQVARELARALGLEVVIVDANDLGVDLLGRSSRNISAAFVKAVFRDNPLGQTDEQTPLGLVRRQ